MKKILLVFVLSLLMIGIVSAWEFDNVKIYSVNTKTVTIKDSLLGIPTTTVAEIQLKTPLINRVGLGYQRVAEMQFTAYEDFKSYISNVELYDRRNNMKPISKNLEFKYKTTELIYVDDYKCSDKLNKNGSLEESCVISGGKYEEREVWKDLTEYSFKSGEPVTVGIYTNVELGETVEWIPNIYGVRIQEWATWTADLNTNLISYYKLDGNVLDARGNYNGTNDDTTNVSGIINSGRQAGNTKDFNTSAYPIANNGTINFWIKKSDPNADFMVMQFAGDTDTGANLIGLFNAGANFGYYPYGTSSGGAFISINTSETNSLLNNNWNMVTITWANTSFSTNKIYVNGISKTITQLGGSGAGGGIRINGVFNVGKRKDGYTWAQTVDIDEIGIWDRVLNSTEITQLFNSGAGMTYTNIFGADISLNAPVTAYNSSTSLITFNTTVIDTGTGIANVSLYINGTLNETNTSGVNGTYIFNKNFSDGTYNWSIRAFDSIAQQTNSAVRTFTVDTTPPTVRIISPTSITYGASGLNTSLLYSINDSRISTCWYNFNGTNTTTPCASNSSFLLADINTRTLILYANDTLGNLGSANLSWNYSVYNNNQTYNSSSYETASETFTLNITTDGLATAPTAFLNYKGTSYAGTRTGSNPYVFTKTIDVPTGVGNNLWNWTISYNGTNYSTSNYNQTISALNWTLCSTAPMDTKYLNFTFKNETLLQESVTASMISTWTYYLGSGTVNKSYSFTNTTENSGYTFCGNPPNKTIYVLPTVYYYNSYSQQRTYSPSVLTLTNSTTNTTLWLLPTNDGSYVSFQVVNAALEQIEGVLIQISLSGYGAIESKYTDASGIATFWLSPLNSYSVQASKTGYTTLTTSVTPTQSSYTLNMDSGSLFSSTIASNVKGISYSISPTSVSLINDTDYTFWFNLTSTYYDVEEFGFSLLDENGTEVGSTSAATNGGNVNVDYNSGTNSRITMNYYWIVSGNQSNGSRIWVVFDSSETQYSLDNLKDRIQFYINNDSDGIFGLKGNSLNMIVFLIVIISGGVVGLKFGLDRPVIVVGVMFAVTGFFDTLGFITYPDSFPLGYEASVLMGILFIVAILGEVNR